MDTVGIILPRLVRFLFEEIASFFFPRQKPLHKARFAKVTELSSLSRPKQASATPALLLGKSPSGKVLSVLSSPKRPELGNLLAVAPTRGGKGLLAVSQLLTWEGSAVVNDIKGDLFTQTAGARARNGKVFVFDPSEGVGHRFDPLEGAFKERKLRKLAKHLLFDPGDKEQIFTDRAAKMLTQLFLAARELGERPFPYIGRVINGGLNEVARELHSVSPLLARKLLDAEYEWDKDFEADRFRASAWGTLAARLYAFMTEDILRCLAGSDFSARELLFSEEPITVYLRWHETDLLDLSPLIKFIWECLLSDLLLSFDHSPPGLKPKPLLLLIDEAGRTGIPNLPDHTTTVAGRGISLWIAIQSLSQLAEHYGVYGADTLQNNCDTQIFYRQKSWETAEYLVRVLGKKSEFARSQTSHDGHETSEGASEQAVPLKTAQEIMQMEDSEIIGFHGNIPPFEGARMDWRAFPELVRLQAIPPPKLNALPPLPDTQPHTFYERAQSVSHYVDPDHYIPDS